MWFSFFTKLSCLYTPPRSDGKACYASAQPDTALQNETTMHVSPEWRGTHHLLVLGDVNLCTEAKNDMVAAMESRTSSPGLVGLQPGRHACGFCSMQQSRNDHSSWLVVEWHSLLEHVGLLAM